MPDKGRSYALPPAMEQSHLKAPQRNPCCLDIGVSARPMAGIGMLQDNRTSTETKKQDAGNQPAQLL